MLVKSREIEMFVEEQMEKEIVCASQNGVKLVYIPSTKKYAVIYKNEKLTDSMNVAWITEFFNVESNSAKVQMNN